MTDFGKRAGIGDMLKSVYDPLNWGYVVNSRLHNSLTVDQVQDHAPTPHTHLEAHITDLVHDALKIKGVDVVDTAIADGKVLIFRSASGDLVYETPAAGGVTVYGMRAIFVGPQTVPTGTWTLIELDTIDYDNFPGGSFNTTTHQWTCPTAGRYALALSGGFETVLPDGKSIAVLMKKAGTLYGPYVRFCSGGNDYIRVAAADIQQIAQGDVYDMWIRHDNATSLDLQPSVQYTNYLAIHRIG